MFDQPTHHPSYDYRCIPDLPAFDEAKPLFVYDGVCVLCSSFVRFVTKIDRAGLVQFTAAQDPLGQALFRHYGYNHVDFDTNLLIADGKVYDRMAVFCQVMRRMPMPWRLLSVAALIPPPLKDWMYKGIARNRYRTFGRTDACMLPDPAIRDRFV